MGLIKRKAPCKDNPCKELLLFQVFCLVEEVTLVGDVCLLEEFSLPVAEVA